MAITSGKRVAMVLYSGDSDLHSHLVRLVASEKGIPVEIMYVNLADIPEELKTINPYQSVPTLVDRDLVLYSSQPIIEYFDERYPHPPLLPGYPVARAECRLMLYRFEQDWVSLIPALESDNAKQRQAAQKHLRDGLVSIDPIFAQRKYFMGDDYTLVDCMMVTLLWRIAGWGITLPPQAKNLIRYMKKIFAREGVQASLSGVERELPQAIDVKDSE